MNWDDLEMALTTNPGEWISYLDTWNGEVQMFPGGRLGEDDDWPSEEAIDAGLQAGHLLHVEPLGPSVEYGWMADFASTVSDPPLRDLLEVALDGRGAFRRFKDALLDHPAEREAWFAFRDGHVRAAAQEWLAEDGIDPTTAPSRTTPPRRPRCAARCSCDSTATRSTQRSAKESWRGSGGTDNATVRPSGGRGSVPGRAVGRQRVSA